MNKFETLKMYYERGFWDKGRLQKAVEHQWITPEQYKEITGEEYEP